MHGQVDGSIEQRLFDFLGEQPLAADIRERDVGDFVARGLDDFQARLGSQSGQRGGNVPRLP